MLSRIHSSSDKCITSPYTRKGISFCIPAPPSQPQLAPQGPTVGGLQLQPASTTATSKITKRYSCPVPSVSKATIRPRSSAKIQQLLWSRAPSASLNFSLFKLINRSRPVQALPVPMTWTQKCRHTDMTQANASDLESLTSHTHISFIDFQQRQVFCLGDNFKLKLILR